MLSRYWNVLSLHKKCSHLNSTAHLYFLLLPMLFWRLGWQQSYMFYDRKLAKARNKSIVPFLKTFGILWWGGRQILLLFSCKVYILNTTVPQEAFPILDQHHHYTQLVRAMRGHWFMENAFLPSRFCQTWPGWCIGTSYIYGSDGVLTTKTTGNISIVK